MVRKAIAHTFEIAVGILFLAGALAGIVLQIKGILGL